ncbi:MAG: leucine-rich repeat protein [Lachnospiraceae bacterium]|nr:leucine-rich repeat protein [Lachnospiraceae bacterium]
MKSSKGRILTCIAMTLIGLVLFPGYLHAEEADPIDTDVEEAVEAVSDANICGDDLTWSLSSSGVLTITGTGDMYDYGTYLAPWYEMQDKIVQVVVMPGVTSVGRCAFDELSALKSVSLPEGLLSIGRSAFSASEKISEINIPSTVTEIGDNAFGSCKAIKEIELPEGLTEISYEAFAYCTKMETITLPSTLTNIADMAFYCCPRLKSISIPLGVRSIGARAFRYCEDLETLELPDSLTKIGEEAFRDCSKLTKLAIPEGVEEIKNYTFLDCDSLKEIYLPLSVTRVGNGVFTQIGALTDIYYGGYEADWNRIEFGTTNDLLEHVTIHYGYRSDIVRGKCGDNASYKFDPQNGTLFILGYGDMYDFEFDDGEEGVVTIPWWSIYAGIKRIIIANGITSIGDSAFIFHPVTEITIPKSVTVIKDSAFYNAYALEFVYYKGKASDRQKIQIGTENGPLHSAIWNYAEKEPSEPTYTSTKLKNISVYIGDQPVLLHWGWRYLLQPTNIYYSDIAYAGLYLSDKSESSQSEAEGALTKLGFDNVRSNYYGDGFSDIYNRTAYSIGAAELRLQGQKNKLVVAMVMRGTQNLTEGIFKDLKGGRFNGFYDTGKNTFESMDQYIKTYYPSYGKENIVLFLTGHSLGGATAAQVARFARKNEYHTDPDLCLYLCLPELQYGKRVKVGLLQCVQYYP